MRTHAKSKSWRVRLRWLLAVLSVICVTASLAVAIALKIRADHSKFANDKPYNQLTKAANDARIDQSKNMLQVGLLLLAALWALVAAKKDEVRIVLSDRPELLMFLCASALLLSSFVFHFFFVSDVVYLYSVGAQVYDKTHPSMPDMFDKNLSYSFQFQLMFLSSGFVVAVLTLISAHTLKRNG
jgi:hypothetical protein